MKVTNAQITKAIENATGHNGVKVFVSRGKGVAHFYTEGDEPGPIDGVYSPTVYCINKLSDQSVSDWVVDYQNCLTATS